MNALIHASENDFGVLICTTGQGMCMYANGVGLRHGITAGVCRNREDVIGVRQHNHARVLCLGAKYTDADEAERLVRIFIGTADSPEQRHVRRVQKMIKDAKG